MNFQMRISILLLLAVLCFGLVFRPFFDENEININLIISLIAIVGLVVVISPKTLTGLLRGG